MANIVKLIEYFNCNVITENTFDKDKWIKLNKKAMKVGYWIHPNAANEYTEAFLKTKIVDYNSTFYKTFNDVVSKTRFELLCDQLLHYITTYGTDFNCGNGYVPNDGGINIESTFKNYKVIIGCTVDEMLEKCASLVYSGIALNQTTMKTVMDFIIETNKNFINVDNIKNREALVYFCAHTGILPNDPISLFRYIIYIVTGETVIIKNDRLIEMISFNSTKFDFSKLNESQMIGLASIFNRFKPLFLAFKHNKATWYTTDKNSETVKINTTNKSCINKLRKMSKKYHKPMVKSDINSIINTEYSINEIKRIISNVNSFKLISLINICREIMSNGKYVMYNIRNGKTFFTEANTQYNTAYIRMLNTVLMDEIRNRMADKTCYVKYPTNINIAAPTSEKNFIGNIPFGSNFEINENNYIGIYWRNEWGARDFDLSFTGMNGIHYGWNSGYYSQERDVIYSGDMTNAEPEAAEYFYFNKNTINGIFSVNRFNGEQNSQYRLVYGADSNPTNFGRGYIFDPSTLLFETDIISDNPMQNIGLVLNGKFYITNRTVGQGTVGSVYVTYKDNIIGALNSKLSNCISINELLEYCGFVDITTVEDPDENIDVIDFRNIDKQTLINLFA